MLFHRDFVAHKSEENDNELQCSEWHIEQGRSVSVESETFQNERTEGICDLSPQIIRECHGNPEVRFGLQQSFADMRPLETQAVTCCTCTPLVSAQAFQSLSTLDWRKKASACYIIVEPPVSKGR